MQAMFIDKFGVDGYRGLAEEQLLARNEMMVMGRNVNLE